MGARTALISVGTNNRYDHPKEEWIEPATKGACRLLCTQVTRRCHPALEQSDEVALHRARLITQHKQWVEPQYRHLTAKGKAKKAFLEVPCAGTVLVNLLLDGQVEVWPKAEHERVVDEWLHPLCRAPAD